MKRKYWQPVSPEESSSRNNVLVLLDVAPSSIIHSESAAFVLACETYCRGQGTRSRKGKGHLRSNVGF